MCAPRASASTSSGCAYSRSIRSRTRRSREGKLETRRQFDCYPRLYAPMAVPSVVLSFLPLLEDVIEKADGVTTTTWRYGTLWEMAGRDGGGPAAAGVVILASFVVLLVLATVRVRSKALPMPTPDLTDAGVADVALLLVILGTAVIHAVHLRRWRARLTRSLVPAPGPQQDARDGAEHHGGES